MVRGKRETKKTQGLVWTGGMLSGRWEWTGDTTTTTDSEDARRQREWTIGEHYCGLGKALASGIKSRKLAFLYYVSGLRHLVKLRQSTGKREDLDNYTVKRLEEAEQLRKLIEVAEVAEAECNTENPENQADSSSTASVSVTHKLHIQESIVISCRDPHRAPHMHRERPEPKQPKRPFEKSYPETDYDTEPMPTLKAARLQRLLKHWVW